MKKWGSFSTYLLIFFGFCLTVGQFVPIYFVNSHWREKFYIVLSLLLVIVITHSTFTNLRKRNKYSAFAAILSSLSIGFLAFILAGIWTLFLLLSVWSDAKIYYIKKSNPNVKIVSRYVNLGAGGGGTEPEDYQIVLHRPLSFIFKIETSIDTALIDKKDWTRVP